MLYSFSCVIPRPLNFMYRRFGTLCLFHLHRWYRLCSCLHRLWIWNRQGVPKRRYVKFRRGGITQKKEYNEPWDCRVFRYVFADLDWNCADESTVLNPNVVKCCVPDCTASQPPKDHRVFVYHHKNIRSQCVDGVTIILGDFFNVHGSVHSKNILIYIQQDATLHSLLYLENCSTCFGWYLHP